jgi:hypothetical protein
LYERNDLAGIAGHPEATLWGAKPRRTGFPGPWVKMGIGFALKKGNN